GGNLGQQLVMGHAHRRRQPGLLCDALLEPGANRRQRLAVLANAFADVDEGLVKAEPLDPIAELPEQREDPAGNFTVSIETRGNEHTRGAKPPGPGAGHRRAYAILPGFVAGCRHHAARAAATHHDRAAAQFGMITLFNAGVEGIHVDMDDGAVTHIDDRASVDHNDIDRRTSGAPTAPGAW